MEFYLTRRNMLALASAGAISLASPLIAQDTPLRLAFIPQENPDKLSGTPDHRDVVLSEAERAAGNVMQICVSRAKSPRLVLDI